MLAVFLMLVSLLIVLAPASANQEPMRGRAPAPSVSQSQPNPLFSKLIPILRQRTRVPLRLPAFVPYSEQNNYESAKAEDGVDNLYAILDGADERSYGIQLAFDKDCQGGNACHVGELGGSTIFHDDYPGQPKIAVKLRRGIKGYFVNATCGAHCDDSIIYWSENGYHYSVALKGGDKQMLLQMANSAIEVAHAQSRGGTCKNCKRPNRDAP